MAEAPKIELFVKVTITVMCFKSAQEMGTINNNNLFLIIRIIFIIVNSIILNSLQFD